MKDYLRRQKKADYGFCANLKVTVLSEIEYLNAKIKYLKNENENCLKILNSGDTWAKQSKTDSLKLMCLFNIYGKEKIKKLILSKSDKIIKRGQNYLYEKICIDLNSLNHTFCFNDQDDSFDYKKEITLLGIIRQTNFKKLLLN